MAGDSPLSKIKCLAEYQRGSSPPFRTSAELLQPPPVLARHGDARVQVAAVAARLQRARRLDPGRSRDRRRDARRALPPAARAQAGLGPPHSRARPTPATRPPAGRSASPSAVSPRRAGARGARWSPARRRPAAHRRPARRRRVSTTSWMVLVTSVRCGKRLTGYRPRVASFIVNAPCHARSSFAARSHVPRAERAFCHEATAGGTQQGRAAR